MTPARIAVATALTQISSFRALVDAAAEPEPEHAPDLVGQETGDHKHQQRVRITDKVASQSLMRAPATNARRKRWCRPLCR